MTLAVAAGASCPIDLEPGSQQRYEVSGHYDWQEVWVPADFTPNERWPVILYYHGYSDGLRPNTVIMRAVTEGHGYVIVGMDYGTARYYETLEMSGLRREVRRLHETLEMLETCMDIDRDAVFVGGYSQGGYSATKVGERVLDELAGMIVLGAGRGWGRGRMPPRDLIADFPVFIAAGEDDDPHGLRAEASVLVYANWDAIVSVERWPETDHFEGWRWYQGAPGRGANLREWLDQHSGLADPAE
jgi:predicted peptidase